LILTYSPNPNGGGEMGLEKVRKVYCKFIESKQTDSGRVIVIDPVFGNKMELIYNEDSEGGIPSPETWIHVEYMNETVVRTIFKQDVTETKSEEPSVKTPAPMIVTPKGPIRRVRGEILSASVSETAAGMLGTITMKLIDMNLELMIGRSFQGTIPAIGSVVTVLIEDQALPKVLEISTNDDTPITGPAYTPVPKGHGEARWPKACMGCGETNLSVLKRYIDTWNSIIHPKQKKPQWKEAAKEIGKGFVTGGLVGAAVYSASAARKHAKRKVKQHILRITMYLCDNCRKIGKSYRDFMTVDLFGRGYTFEFRNSKYAEYFRDHNPGRIESSIESR
jgi:hypothetical protein